MEELTKKIDKLSYSFFVFIIGVISFLCVTLLPFCLFAWGIGDLIRFEIKEGIIIVLFGALSVFIGKGAGLVYDKLHSGSDN